MIVKVRYLAQGIIQIPEKDLPSGFETMQKEDAWEWLLEWWDENVTQAMINQGIEDCDSGPTEVNPGILEKCPEGGDYETVAMIREFGAWWNVDQGLEIMDARISLDGD